MRVQLIKEYPLKHFPSKDSKVSIPSADCLPPVISIPLQKEGGQPNPISIRTLSSSFLPACSPTCDGRGGDGGGESGGDGGGGFALHLRKQPLVLRRRGCMILHKGNHRIIRFTFLL
ncbi:unnamed protein product [Prunus armeniaca]